MKTDILLLQIYCRLPYSWVVCQAIFFSPAVWPAHVIETLVIVQVTAHHLSPCPRIWYSMVYSSSFMSFLHVIPRTWGFKFTKSTTFIAFFCVKLPLDGGSGGTSRQKRQNCKVHCRNFMCSSSSLVYFADGLQFFKKIVRQNNVDNERMNATCNKFQF